MFFIILYYRFLSDDSGKICQPWQRDLDICTHLHLTACIFAIASFYDRTNMWTCVYQLFQLLLI